MAIKINFPDKTGGTCENTYIIADISLDNKIKVGRLELAVWKNEEARRSNSQKINNVAIPIIKEERWEKKEIPAPAPEEGEERGEPTFEDSHIACLAWDDIAWKSGEEIYTKIKTLIISINGELIDLSQSTDIL